MQMIRKIVKRKSVKEFSIPKEFGENVEIIIIPASETRSAEPYQAITVENKLSGFAHAMLENDNEDVWNDL